MQSYKFNAADSCRRLDIMLVDYFEEIGDAFSRSAIQNLIRSGSVRVEGKLVKSSRPVKKGELIEIDVSEEEKLELISQDIPLRVVYQDEHIIVVNKPAGMVVHPAPGNYKDTVLNAVLHLTKGKLSTIGGSTRPGVVHRLDKDTSGLFVIAKDKISHMDLARQFADKSAGRSYTAVLCGIPKLRKDRIETLYSRHHSDRKKFTSKTSNGKLAVSNYVVLQESDKHSKVKVKLETGRTHQIRVHMKDLGHPVLGDVVYGKKDADISRQALHAGKLTINHPVFGVRMSFFSPLEDDIIGVMKKLGLY